MIADLINLIARVGLDPRRATLEQILALVRAEASMHRGRAMAAVKLCKGELLVTRDEAEAALHDPETPGDPIASARILRAGENAWLYVLAGMRFCDPALASLRIATNIDLDRGEVSVMAMPSPTRKRQAGRPSRSADFARMLAMDVHFRLGAGEGSSVEKIVELLTGRDRNGDAIRGIAPMVVLPNGRKSHWTIHAMLRSAARDAQPLIAEARRQGEMVRAGGTADAGFYDRLMQVRAILANPAAVKSMLRGVRRKN